MMFSTPNCYCALLAAFETFYEKHLIIIVMSIWRYSGKIKIAANQKTVDYIDPQDCEQCQIPQRKRIYWMKEDDKCSQVQCL